MAHAISPRASFLNAVYDCYTLNPEGSRTQIMGFQGFRVQVLGLRVQGPK